MITSTYTKYKLGPHQSKALLAEMEERRLKYLEDLSNEIILRAEKDPDFLYKPLEDKYTKKELPDALVLNYLFVQVSPLSTVDDQFIN